MKNLKRRLSALTYALTGAVTRAVLYTFARLEVRGRENVPQSGSVILVGNHIHGLDPPMVGAVSPRRVHPMAKRELFETALVGWFFWAYGAFPVRRFSGDMGALRVAKNYLREGDVVLMFPEGTRSPSGAMQPALPGAAMVALLARCPIVPVAVTGTRVKVPNAFWAWVRRDRPSITVTFGKPFDLVDLASDTRAAEVGTDRMMRRIAELLPESMHGAYGAGSEGEVVVLRQARSTDDAPGGDLDA